jgi:AcrR family transcriptional regulator
MSDAERPAGRRGRPPQHDRIELLRAARTVAAERGFDGLRFSDVSAATGVPVSSLQYAFGTREALVRDVLRAGVADELDWLREAVDQLDDPWERVERFIRKSVTVDEQDRRDGWLLWMQYWRAALRDEELRDEVADTTRRWRALMRQAVDDGVSGGQFSIVGTPDEAAAALIALVDGVSLQVLMGDTSFGRDQAIRTATSSARRILGTADA